MIPVHIEQGRICPAYSDIYLPGSQLIPHLNGIPSRYRESDDPALLISIVMNGYPEYFPQLAAQQPRQVPDPIPDPLDPQVKYIVDGLTQSEAKPPVLLIQLKTPRIPP